MSDDRPSVYFDEEANVWVYRISGAGLCVRALVAIAQEYEPSRTPTQQARLTRTAKEGHYHEGILRAELEEKGFVFEDTQPVVELPVYKGSVILRGHLDGVMTSPEGVEEIWEAKSMSKDQYNKWVSKGFAAFPKYATQITCYMEAYPGRVARYTVKNRNDGSIDERVLTEPPMAFADVKKKIRKAETHRRKGGLPKCDLVDDWFCDFKYLHEEEILEDDLSDEVKAELVEMAERFAELQTIEKAGEEAKEQRRQLGRDMMAKMGDLPAVELDGFKVSQVSFLRDQTSWKEVTAEADEAMTALIRKWTQPVEISYPKVTKR